MTDIRIVSYRRDLAPAFQRLNLDWIERLFVVEDADRKVVEAVAAVAAARGLPRAQIALAWLLGKPGVTAPIIGATKPYHLSDAIAALDVTLSAEEVQQLETAYVPHPVVGFQ